MGIEKMEGIKGSSTICLVGVPTTVEAAVMPPPQTITMDNIMATTMANTTTVNTTMATTTVNTTTVNMEVDNTTTATTTMDSAVGSQMEVDVSVTTGSPLGISIATLMEPVKGRTTLEERGATQQVGATPGVEICKPQNDSQTTHGLIRLVDITDDIIFLVGSVEESIKLRISQK